MTDSPVQRAVRVVLEWDENPHGTPLASMIAHEIREAENVAREAAFAEMMPQAQRLSDMKDALERRIVALEKARGK